MLRLAHFGSTPIMDLAAVPGSGSSNRALLLTKVVRLTGMALDGETAPGIQSRGYKNNAG
jgi:hypothetical protein